MYRPTWLIKICYFDITPLIQLIPLITTSEEHWIKIIIVSSEVQMVYYFTKQSEISTTCICHCFKTKGCAEKRNYSLFYFLTANRFYITTFSNEWLARSKDW